MKKKIKKRPHGTQKKTIVYSQRDTSRITKRQKRSLLAKSHRTKERQRRTAINADRRRWTPVHALNILNNSGLPAGIEARDAALKSGVSINRREVDQRRFKKPETVSVCKRRSKRREMLFKLRKAGKGISGPKKRKYTDTSEMRCK